MSVLTSRESRREYLSVAEVAVLLGCSAPTIRRRVATGELRAVKFGAGRNFRAFVS
jgi:excisionase family DNA binding protein